jgi:hypothetical protein
MTTPSTDLLESLRALHQPRLFGFALLLTLGDRVLASAATHAAFAEVRDRTAMDHPERAAAWLRRRVVARVGRKATVSWSALEQRVGLGAVAVDGPALTGLTRLNPAERAALIAADIERLDLRDVATIVSRRGRRLATLLEGARRRYLGGYAAAARDEPPTGAIPERVREIARRAVA